MGTAWSTCWREQPRAEAFIALPSRLHNRYFLVRHGESKLELEQMILSDPSCKYDFNFSLTNRGREQMRNAALEIERMGGSVSWIYTSNFQRAFQSALILREELGLLYSNFRTEFSGLLDPRKMGRLERSKVDNWKTIWEQDQVDLHSAPPPVLSSLQPSASTESVIDLYRRALEAFTRLEGSYYGQDIVLVSHQDTLSVFTAALYGTDLRQHHVDYPYELGQVRLVDLTKPPKNYEYDPRDLKGTFAPGDTVTSYPGLR